MVAIVTEWQEFLGNRISSDPPPSEIAGDLRRQKYLRSEDHGVGGSSRIDAMVEGNATDGGFSLGHPELAEISHRSVV